MQWAALISFVMVTSFTPGPNNVSSMSLGISFGYRRSLRFLGGIAAGFVLVMLACAVISAMLFRFLPSIEPYMKIVGSLYIVWLAIHTFIGSLREGAASGKALGFLDGFLLQVLNVKVIVYGLTLYSTFLSPIAGSGALIPLSALALAFVGFAAISTWNLAGATFSQVFQRAVPRRILATALSLLLLYSAAESSGLLQLASERL